MKFSQNKPRDKPKVQFIRILDFKRLNLNTIFTLIFIVWARFFGLFVVLPVLSVYVSGTALQIGLAVGAYALSQIIFATPFGHLSDKIGRKKTLALGIVVFGVGSLICANANDANMLILGRFIQGAGAVAGVASAFIADIVPDNQKSKYMAMLGMGIGLAFVIAVIFGPILAGNFGLSALFDLCALLCAFSLFMLLFISDAPKHESQKSSFAQILTNKNVKVLCASNFLQKMFLNAFFVGLGLVLVEKLGFLRADLWQIYAPSAICGFLAMGVAGFLGDAKGKAKELFFASVGFFVLSIAALSGAGLYESLVFAFIGAAVFFVAFSLQEPILQSQMSKLTKANRGMALGLLNACGYAGSFVGSMLGAYTGVTLYVMLGLCALWAWMLGKLDRI